MDKDDAQVLLDEMHLAEVTLLIKVAQALRHVIGNESDHHSLSISEAMKPFEETAEWASRVITIAKLKRGE